MDMNLLRVLLSISLLLPLPYPLLLLARMLDLQLLEDMELNQQNQRLLTLLWLGLDLELVGMLNEMMVGKLLMKLRGLHTILRLCNFARHQTG